MFHHKDIRLRLTRMQKHENCNKEGKKQKVGGTGVGFFANTIKDKLQYHNDLGRWEEKHCIGDAVQILDDGITGNKRGTIHDRTRWKDSKDKTKYRLARRVKKDERINLSL